MRILKDWALINIQRKPYITKYELAAMAGHEAARYTLGGIEHDSIERAIKHFMILASAGHKESMKMI